MKGSPLGIGTDIGEFFVQNIRCLLTIFRRFNPSTICLLWHLWPQAKCRSSTPWRSKWSPRWHGEHHWCSWTNGPNRGRHGSLLQGKTPQGRSNQVTKIIIDIDADSTSSRTLAGRTPSSGNSLERYTEHPQSSQDRCDVPRWNRQSTPSRSQNSQ